MTLFFYQQVNTSTERNQRSESASMRIKQKKTQPEKGKERKSPKIKKAKTYKKKKPGFRLVETNRPFRDANFQSRLDRLRLRNINRRLRSLHHLRTCVFLGIDRTSIRGINRIINRIQRANTPAGSPPRE